MTRPTAAQLDQIRDAGARSRKAVAVRAALRATGRPMPDADTVARYTDAEWWSLAELASDYADRYIVLLSAATRSVVVDTIRQANAADASQVDPFDL